MKNISKIYFIEKNLSSSEDFTNKILDLDPNNAEALNILGLIKSTRNQKEDAKASSSVSIWFFEKK